MKTNKVMKIYNYKEIEARCNYFENFNSADLMKGLPVMIRMDGNNFKAFTKGLKRPYDIRLTDLMIEACRFAVELTNAKCGFVGSDEISLVLYSDDYNKEIFYAGKKRKILSILPAMVSVYFNKILAGYLPEKSNTSPSFDCRAWNVPTLDEACNAFYIREQSVFKNAITMAALAPNMYSNKQIQGINGKVKQEMLFAKGVNFNDYPVEFKRGVYIQRRKIIKQGFNYTLEELEALPEKHEARTNPDKVSEITEIRQLDMPIFSKIVNPIDTVIWGADPIVETETETEEIKEKLV